ncbi:hypothetical protein CYMTET_33326 [Cymbomonas tetramitiformis]|uniref:Uncharacterized protein n=1 Tax=Cymbomonas tetramitiformis TaxID=36881 RepID=A0AAE0KR04_9CHLO|nr:hypothetical protein CYMTET_33326 [Cymbomonas tetramitiformis]
MGIGYLSCDHTGGIQRKPGGGNSLPTVELSDVQFSSVEEGEMRHFPSIVRQLVLERSRTQGTKSVDVFLHTYASPYEHDIIEWTSQVSGGRCESNLKSYVVARAVPK